MGVECAAEVMSYRIWGRRPSLRTWLFFFFQKAQIDEKSSGEEAQELRKVEESKYFVLRQQSNKQQARMNSVSQVPNTDLSGCFGGAR